MLPDDVPPKAITWRFEMTKLSVAVVAVTVRLMEMLDDETVIEFTVIFPLDGVTVTAPGATKAKLLGAVRMNVVPVCVAKPLLTVSEMVMLLSVCTAPPEHKDAGDAAVTDVCAKAPEKEPIEKRIAQAESQRRSIGDFNLTR